MCAVAAPTPMGACSLGVALYVVSVWWAESSLGLRPVAEGEAKQPAAHWWTIKWTIEGRWLRLLATFPPESLCVSFYLDAVSFYLEAVLENPVDSCSTRHTQEVSSSALRSHRPNWGFLLHPGMDLKPKGMHRCVNAIFSQLLNQWSSWGALWRPGQPRAERRGLGSPSPPAFCAEGGLLVGGTITVLYRV
jgi:hypothetical protein